MVDPIGEEIRSLLDGHIVLSQKLAGAGHYPAIDIRQSVSRLMPQLVNREAVRLVAKCRDWLAKYEDAELLLQIGEYRQGNDLDLDYAIRAHADLVGFLQQEEGEPIDSRAVCDALQTIVTAHAPDAIEPSGKDKLNG